MRLSFFIGLAFSLACAGCGNQFRGSGSGSGVGGIFGGDDAGGAGGDDLTTAATGDVDLAGTAVQNGCANEVGNCYTVYAHSPHVLYNIDLKNKDLITVGPFKAPKVSGAEDSITDLAVSSMGTIYAISSTALYTADATDGHVTRIGPVTACGKDNVALTFTPDGNLYVADHVGAFCRIDLSTTPPTVTPLASIGGGLAIAGDLVAVKDGEMFGTAYNPADSATSKNNTLVILNPATGKAKTIGVIGFGKLFGLAVAEGKFFAFTADQTGRVVTIDPMTGAGTVYNTFLEPGTSKPIDFWGAGVSTNAELPPIG